jgi:hypothetical protein
MNIGASSGSESGYSITCSYYYIKMQLPIRIRMKISPIISVIICQIMHFCVCGNHRALSLQVFQI